MTIRNVNHEFNIVMMCTVYNFHKKHPTTKDLQMYVQTLLKIGPVDTIEIAHQEWNSVRIF